MEAEYIALSAAMRDLLPGIALLKESGAKLQLSFCKESVILSKVWEDNTGTIRLEEAAHKVNFCMKYIVVKYHFFCSHLSDEVRVQKLDTTEQLTDVFTKSLAQHQFEKLVAGQPVG